MESQTQLRSLTDAEMKKEVEARLDFLKELFRNKSDPRMLTYEERKAVFDVFLLNGGVREKAEKSARDAGKSKARRYAFLLISLGLILGLQMTIEGNRINPEEPWLDALNRSWRHDMTTRRPLQIIALGMFALWALYYKLSTGLGWFFVDIKKHQELERAKYVENSLFNDEFAEEVFPRIKSMVYQAGFIGAEAYQLEQSLKGVVLEQFERLASTAAVPTPNGGAKVVAELSILSELKQLQESGLITLEDYEERKAKLLEKI